MLNRDIAMYDYAVSIYSAKASHTCQAFESVVVKTEKSWIVICTLSAIAMKITVWKNLDKTYDAYARSVWSISCVDFMKRITLLREIALAGLNDFNLLDINADCNSEIKALSRSNAYQCHLFKLDSLISCQAHGLANTVRFALALLTLVKK